LRIIAILADGKQYVSQLAREAEMSRPLLYMHLQKMEKAGIVKTEMKISEDGKAMKFYELLPFEFRITPELIREAAKTLTIKKKEGN
ncbi:winged helix-turn-helix transcriptional regulator, partial [Algoriphagus aestuarii]|nr:winged helix-turn-helix transcriptional regulator [Algoriphagus aestuarii]